MWISGTARAVAAVALLLPVLTSCGDDVPPPLPPGQTTGTDTDVPARKAVAQAVARMKKQDTGSFDAAIGQNRESGSYQISTGSAVVTRIYVAPGTSAAFTDTTRTPDGVWMRIRTATMNRRKACWVISGAGLGQTAQGIPGAYAGAVGTALTAQGKKWNDDEVVGSVSLAQVLITIEPTLLASAEVAGVPDARVPASFVLAHGEMQGWRVDSADLIAAMSRADLTATGALSGVANLDGFILDVQFGDQGKKVDVTAPARERVILAVPKETLLKRARACARQ